MLDSEADGLDMEAGDDGADQAIVQAIQEAVLAGAFRSAARHNPKSARVWDTLAEPYSRRVAALLETAIRTLGAEDAEPFARGEE
jgi:hypothetical protein